MPETPVSHSGEVQGNEESLEEAYIKRVAGLKKYVASNLDSEAPVVDVDDVVQETFVRAYSAKKSQKLKFAGAYLYRTAKNLVFERNKRSKKRMMESIQSFKNEGVLSTLAVPGPQEAKGTQIKEVMDLLGDLPPKCRQVFYMRHFSGMSYAEISEAMGISEKTVEKHLAKGLSIMTKQLSKTNRVVAHS